MAARRRRAGPAVPVAGHGRVGGAAAQGRRAPPRRVRREPGRGGAVPGRPAHPCRRQVRRPGRAHVLHPRRPRAGHPAAGRRPPCRSHGGGLPRVAGRPRLRHRRRPDRLLPGRDHRGRCRPRPDAGCDRAGQPRRARARRRGEGGRRDDARHDRVRGGLRRPGPSYRRRPHLRRRRVDASVDLRRAGAPRRRLRQGRARHPARAGAARGRGRVGQRPRRSQGGGTLVGPAGHHRPTGDGARQTAAWPRSPTRTTPARRYDGWGSTSTSPTAR